MLAVAAVGVHLVPAAIAFMILELTTDLDAATGAFIFLTVFVLNVGLILARRRQEVATDIPVVPF